MLYSPIPPMQTKNIAIFVKCQPQWPAAAMSKYFRLFIIGGFETNNITYSVTCINIVIIVEEYVFRSIDFAQSDQLDITQTIIKCVG